LSEAEIHRGVAALAGWCVRDGQLWREWTFPDFVEAFGFMGRVALLAERTGHHPDWSNGYNKVVIRLSTHEVGGITRKDLDLAREIDGLGRADGSGGENHG